MRPLKITELSDQHQGVVLHGDPARPEPTYISIRFPTGQVTVSRVEAADYWVNLTTHHGVGEAVGRFTDARADNEHVHAGTMEERMLAALAAFRAVPEDRTMDRAFAALRVACELDALLADPDTYHLAVRMGAR